jgi:hypothetical protein
MSTQALHQRIQELLDQLERRARKCPGMAPVEAAAEFLALAAWKSGVPRDAVNEADLARLADGLETLWRHPQEAHSWVNALLIERGGLTPLASVAGTSAAPDWRQRLKTSLRPCPRMSQGSRPPVDGAVCDLSMLGLGLQDPDHFLAHAGGGGGIHSAGGKDALIHLRDGPSDP